MILRDNLSIQICEPNFSSNHLIAYIGIWQFDFFFLIFYHFAIESTKVENPKNYPFSLENTNILSPERSLYTDPFLPGVQCVHARRRLNIRGHRERPRPQQRYFWIPIISAKFQKYEIVKWIIDSFDLSLIKKSWIPPSINIQSFSFSLTVLCFNKTVKGKGFVDREIEGPVFI